LQLELIPALERNLNLSSVNLLDVEVLSYIAGEKGVFKMKMMMKAHFE
jgi:hypothetical protein